MRRAWLGSAIVAVVLSASAPARARDAVAAEALFDEGRAAAAQGDYVRACDKFAESQRLDPAAGTVLNLADCSERLGRVATAWQLYREAAEILATKDATRAAFARKRAVALEPRLSQLVVVLEPGAPGAHVTRDGVELGEGSLGAALPLDPGDHEVVVRLAGRADARFRVRVDEGATKTVRVAVGPAVEAAPAGTLGAPRVVGIALLGLSAGAIAAGAVTGAMTLHRKSLVDEHCHAGLCDPSGVDAAAEGRTLSTVSTATFVGGAVGLALGAYLTITGPRWAGAPAVSVRPGVGPGVAAIGLGGSFR
jgi:hypothetical protein